MHAHPGSLVFATANFQKKAFTATIFVACSCFMGVEAGWQFLLP
jgi:hypothetical protein